MVLRKTSRFFVVVLQLASLILCVWTVFRRYFIEWGEMGISVCVHFVCICSFFPFFFSKFVCEQLIQWLETCSDYRDRSVRFWQWKNGPSLFPGGWRQTLAIYLYGKINDTMRKVFHCWVWLVSVLQFSVVLLALSVFCVFSDWSCSLRNLKWAVSLGVSVCVSLA